MKNNLKLNPNTIATYLGKEPSEFTKADIIRFIEENEIKMVNFRYVAQDGRLKTLNFVITSMDYLESFLSSGERVDGSSLFSFIEAGSSDLYVIPKFKTAFLNPFAEIPTVDILCSYYTKDGVPFDGSPEYTLKKAHDTFKKTTGYSFQAMGELEYYLIDDKQELFETPDQRGYHESSPFTKFEQFRSEVMLAIASIGGQIKYGHSEVGNFTLNGKFYEQNEIEFRVTDVEDAASQLLLGKWVIRNLAYQYGFDVTFAPKITTGKAGSGLHFHTCIVDKNGKNMMVKDGKLSDDAKRAIAGYLDCATSLTAFGNTNPTSYFRLVPHQEAPTTVCWGDRNRSVLVRVPLGWLGDKDMVADANPMEPKSGIDFSQKQTVEFRCPDGSADVYLMLAGLVVAARHGFEMANNLEFANSKYVSVNIHNDENADKMNSLTQLPVSCFESAEVLDKNRSIYEKYGVFSSALIDGLIKKLKSYDDKNIRTQIKEQPEFMLEVVKKYYHCG